MPPFPSRAMMRERDATSRPGRNRPSFSEYSAELEGRDEDADAARGGNGEVDVAKSSVATSSVFEAGLPQEEQKRTWLESSVPHDVHLAMIFPATVYLVLACAALIGMRQSDSREPRAGGPSCITIQSDDFTLGAVVGGSSISFMSDRGLGRLRGAIGRNGHRTYHAHAADFAAASVSQRVSRVRLARPRRPHLQLVRDRSIAAHAARGPGRHMDRALEYFFRIRRRPCGAQYCRQLQHQHPGQCAHRADRVPPAAPVAL